MGVSKVALVGISYRAKTPNFSVVRQMLGIGHFALMRTYSKDARQGRTTQGFGVFLWGQADRTPPESSALESAARKERHPALHPVHGFWPVSEGPE